jgi:anti-anti-sigma regulatory factor
MSEPIAIEPRASGSALVLRGRVTVEHARLLHERAVELRLAAGPVAVDCADVERLDASALQVLLALRVALLAAGRHLVLEHVPAALDATLRLAGAEALLGSTAFTATPEGSS